MRKVRHSTHIFGGGKGRCWPTFCDGQQRDALSLVERQGTESRNVVRHHGPGLAQGHRRGPAHVLYPGASERLLLHGGKSHADAGDVRAHSRA